MNAATATTACASMNASIAMRWRTSVSSETWRCAPVANTAIIASAITASGTKRRSREAGRPGAQDDD